jgi:hypothetical protein
MKRICGRELGTSYSFTGSHLIVEFRSAFSFFFYCYRTVLHEFDPCHVLYVHTSNKLCTLFTI